MWRASWKPFPVQLGPQVAGGIRTAATTRRKTHGPCSSSTRITDPAMPPDTVPVRTYRLARLR